jgi:hypothetical protein
MIIKVTKKVVDNNRKLPCHYGAGCSVKKLVVQQIEIAAEEKLYGSYCADNCKFDYKVK